MSGPAQKNVDFVTFKDFLFTERLRLQFRGEFSTFFNHPSFGLPDRNTQSSSFGQIHSASAPRDIQFGLKLIF